MTDREFLEHLLLFLSKEADKYEAQAKVALFDASNAKWPGDPRYFVGMRQALLNTQGLVANFLGAGVQMYRSEAR